MKVYFNTYYNFFGLHSAVTVTVASLVVVAWSSSKVGSPLLLLWLFLQGLHTAVTVTVASLVVVA